MSVVGDLLGQERRSDRTALRQPGRTPATVDYDRLCVQSWKVAHLLRRRGVHTGAVVAIAADRSRGAVLAFLGAALLGATVQVGDLTDRELTADAPRVIVGPTPDLPPPSTDPAASRVGYGSPPADPAVAHLERDAWSENPTPPPETVSPETPLLTGEPGSIPQERVVSAATRIVDRLDVTAEDTIAVRSSLSHHGTVVAGIVAPLVAGGTIGFLDGETPGDVAVAVAGENVPENRVVNPVDVI